MATATVHNASHHYDVLVLGAGMSGLACASKLHQHQHYKERNRLLVLEARGRVGGRIQSVHVNGSRLDTGANWIHGIGTEAEPNPLMTILPQKRYKQLNGVVTFSAGRSSESHVSDKASDWVDLDSVDSVQQLRRTDSVVPASASGAIMAALWDMIDSLHEMATSKSATDAKATTILSAITQRSEFREAFKAIPVEYHRTLASMPQFVEAMEAGPLAKRSAEQSKGSVGMGLLEFAINDFDGDQVFLQDGYTAVVDEVAKDLVAAGLIEFGVEVEQIDWNTKPIRIDTSKGSYTADQVLCTLPLGVLRHKAPRSSSASHTSFFTPSLPADKRESIQSLGFGTLDKIMLVYEKSWWTEEPWISIWKHGLVDRPLDTDANDSGGFLEREQTSPDSFFGFTDELAGIEIPEDGTTSSGPRLLSIINLENLTGQPVLSCFVSCSNAVQVEAMSDDQAGGIVHRALTKWLGREPPTPDAVHVSRWAADQYARGSYSHMIAGLSETRHREAFQQPIRNDRGAVLRFAGEHTSRNHFATVHGALISGWREAESILKDTER